MGISLNGLTPAGTYPGLIKTGDNTAISGTPKVLSDGNGNNLPMEVSTTEVNFTNQLKQGGVAVPTASQVAAKQDTLVSGTNIKTINGASLLGSGNIPVVTSPSGVSGAIQFSNGSAFASDAANFFWDDTNKRLGVGTNSPNGKMQIITNDATSPFAYSSQLTQLAGSALQGLLVGYSSTNGSFISSVFPGNSFSNMTYTALEHRFSNAGTIAMTIHTNGNTTIGNGTTALGARVGIKGSGSTSATTSLLVQNSGGFSSLQVRDDNLVQGFNNANGVRFKLGYNGASGQAISTRDGEFAVGLIDSGQSPALRFLVLGSGFSYIDGYTEGTAKAQNYPMVFGSRANNSSFLVTNSTTQENGSQAIFGYAVNEASAQVIVNSTTRGFLPPRMTTTQKNAIASPAAGLVLYDSTTNKLQCYNGSTWNDLF
jgi:hypothetical protein